MPDQSLLIVDSHLDLAFSAIQVNRDLTQPAATVRTHDREPVLRSFGSCTVTFPELRRGRIGIVFGTVMSRIDPNDAWTRTGMYCQEQCYGVGRGHQAYYRALEREGLLRLIRTAADLDASVAAWEHPTTETPIGLVLAMESADPILGPDQVPEWWEAGLRSLSLTHFGANTYGHGTGTQGGLYPPAYALMDALRKFPIVLDLTHAAEVAFWQILDHWDGPVHASHCVCRALVPGHRHLSDEMVKALCARGAVIGIVFAEQMLNPSWD